MSGSNLKLQKWLQFAHDDLLMAIDILNSAHPICRGICYNCQQSVEKYLKAYQIHFDLEIIKTHDLEHLVNSLTNFDAGLQSFLEKVIVLSNYAVKYRYPDDFEDLTITEAKDAIEIAKEIEKYLLQRIKL